MNKNSFSAAEILTITPLINQKEKIQEKQPIDLSIIQKHTSFMDFNAGTPGESPLQPTYNRTGSRLNSTLKLNNPSLVPVLSKSQYKRKVQTPIKITSIQDGVRGTSMNNNPNIRKNTDS